MIIQIPSKTKPGTETSSIWRGLGLVGIGGMKRLIYLSITSSHYILLLYMRCFIFRPHKHTQTHTHHSAAGHVHCNEIICQAEQLFGNFMCLLICVIRRCISLAPQAKHYTIPKPVVRRMDLLLVLVSSGNLFIKMMGKGQQSRRRSCAGNPRSASTATSS